MKKILYAYKVTRALALSAAVVFVSGAGLSFAGYGGYDSGYDSGYGSEIDITGSNDTTGYNSENKNIWDLDFKTDIDVENKADVDNIIDQWLNTGKNLLDCNTDAGSLTTGDITGTFDVVNELNVGGVSFDGYGYGGDPEITLSNYLTGYNSVNKNLVDVDSDLDVDIDNHAYVDNDIDFDLNTGKNDVTKNTVGGDVETGSIDVAIVVENVVNQDAGNVDLGALAVPPVSADFSNQLTGAQSENINKLDLDHEVDIDVENHADIDNNIYVDANTGKNDVSQNTIVGDVTTGDVSISASVTNIAN
ncbi:MAG: hypothetical protein AAB360_02410 [Patescibacteria group bacterium]